MYNVRNIIRFSSFFIYLICLSSTLNGQINEIEEYTIPDFQFDWDIKPLYNFYNYEYSMGVSYKNNYLSCQMVAMGMVVAYHRMPEVFPDISNTFTVPGESVTLRRDRWEMQQRNGLKTRLIPRGNRYEWDDLPKNLPVNYPDETLTDPEPVRKGTQIERVATILYHTQLAAGFTFDDRKLYTSAEAEFMVK